MYLVISPSDIYYLTGVRIHEVGEVMVLYSVETDSANSQLPNSHSLSSLSASILREESKKQSIIFCDPRTSALFDAEKFEIIQTRNTWKQKFSEFPELVTDPDFLTQTLREKIEGYGPKLTMHKSPLTERRVIKNAHEIELLRVSQQMNLAVFEKIVPLILPGITEEEVARKIQILQLELGATGPSFPPIVAFGENTAVPHHSPTARVLQGDEPILIDMGLVYQGYCSDMTRCFTLNSGIQGQVQAQEQGMNFNEIYELLQKVTNFIISWAKPGMKVADLDKKAREMLGEYEPYFTHSLGHGVGIDIHESPRVSIKSDEVLQSGIVITIEPGVYFSGNFSTSNNKRSTINGTFGARYEEMCVVREDGLELL